MTAPTQPPAPFIVGAARSGSTLLRMMLDAHPYLAIPPETHFLINLEKTWRTSSHSRRAVVELLLRDRLWPDFHIDGDQFRQKIESTRASTLTEIVRVFYTMYAERHGSSRWGDKTPRYVMDMPMIAELLPEAHFIHIIRDGRDAALSVLLEWFGPTSIEEAATWWKERVETGQRAGASCNYIEVRYESLVDNPRPELERLCRFLDLDFREEMLTSHTRAGDRLAEERHERRPGERPDQHSRVRVPPDPSRVGRWRTWMTPDARRRFEELAGDTLERLGYPVG